MLIQLIIFVLTIIDLLILARVLMSWVNISPYNNQVARTIFDLTEPILVPIRNMMPSAGMFDFSPLIAFLIINVIISALASA